ncbi:MAG: hypothetical protein ACKOD2_16835 [Ilumatobacteraceae bacterium]
MKGRAQIATGRRRAVSLTVRTVAALGVISRACAEVLGVETQVAVAPNTAHVAGLSRAMVSALEDDSGTAFADGVGGVLHIVN